jgi:hypothetical protein
MAEDTQQNSPAAVSEPIHIAEELEDFEKEDKTRTLVAVGVALVLVAIVISAVWFFTRPKPELKGAFKEAFAVATQSDDVLATVKVELWNAGQKPVWIRDIKAQMTTADGKTYTDTPAPAIDLERYFDAFPDLRVHSSTALTEETKLEAGDAPITRSVILKFPVRLDSFQQRKALSVTVQTYATEVVPKGDNSETVVISEGGPQPAK